MSSREEFLRAMGLTNDDMANPDDAPAPPPRASSRSGGAGGSSSSLLINRERAEPGISKSAANSFSSSSPSMTKTGSGLAGAHRTATKSGSSGLFAGATKSSARSYDDEESSSYTSSSYTAPSSTYTSRPMNQSATGSHEVSAAPEDYSYSHSAASKKEASPPRKTRSELQKEAEEMKAEGNSAFQKQEYRKAIRCYSKAIESDPSNAALYSNRSAAYLAGASQTGMDTRSLALRDAVKASELKPDWPKGYCRQGEALIELERFGEAQEAYETALRIDPGNATFRQRVEECEMKAGPARQTASSINNNLPDKAPVRRSNSSVSFEPRESAREMAARAAEKDETFRGGSFREQELEKLRQRRSLDSFSSSMSSTDGGGVAGSGSSSYFSKARDVPPEYSTGAAKAYQQSLLEAYRKKKSSGQ